MSGPQCRAAMAADPAWGDDLKEAGERGLLIETGNRILRPTAFFEAFRATRRG